jgi:excisionase family DNA binding protein
MSDAKRKSSAVRRTPHSGGHMLTKAETAARLGISVDTVERMIGRGKLKAVRVSARCVRVLEDSLPVAAR